MSENNMSVVDIPQIGNGVLAVGEAGSLTYIDRLSTACKIEISAEKEKGKEYLNGGVGTGERKENFKLKGKISQDFGSNSSLTEFLYNNRGKAMPFVFTPNKQVDKYVTGTCVVEAIGIGGEVGEKPEEDFEWDIVGIPQFKTSSQLNGLLD